MKIGIFAAVALGSLAATSQGAILAYYNYGNAISSSDIVAAPYAPTTVASGVAASNMEFESGWLVVNQQVNTRLGSMSLTVGSQTFNSDSTGTYAAVVDDNFTRTQFTVANEGDNRNNSNPGKGLLQLLTPGNNISNVAETRANNLGFGLTVTASGSTLDLSSLVLQAARFNSNPERSFETLALYADTGSGQFLVATSGVTPVTTTLAPVSFDLSSLPAIADGASVVFRLYGDNGTGGDNGFGREFWIDDLTLNGDVAPIPEPTSVLALAVLGALATTRRRR